MDVTITIARLFQRSLGISRAISFVAFAFWGGAISILAFGWGTAFVPAVKVAIFAGVAAAMLQGLVAAGYTWCMLIAMALRSKQILDGAQAENRIFICAIVAWLCFGAVQFGITLMPYVLIRPWLFGLMLAACAVQAMAIQFARKRIEYAADKSDNSSFSA